MREWIYEPYHDRYGFLHPTERPLPKESENAPLYLSIKIVFKFFFGTLTENDCHEFLNSISLLHGKKLKGFKNKIYRLFGWDWTVTPVSDRYDFSRDNWRIWDAITCIRRRFPHIAKEHKATIDKMCVLHPQLLHPVSFLHALKSKYSLEWTWVDNIW